MATWLGASIGITDSIIDMLSTVDMAKLCTKISTLALALAVLPACGNKIFGSSPTVMYTHP